MQDLHHPKKEWVITLFWKEDIPVQDNKARLRSRKYGEQFLSLSDASTTSYKDA
jgi:hypothetical protein